MRLRVAWILGAASVGLIGGYFASAIHVVEDYRFCPYTLYFESRRVYVLDSGGTLHKGEWTKAPNELLDYLIQSKVVTPVPRGSESPILIRNERSNWRESPLKLDFLNPSGRQILEWSKANPDIASVFWNEGMRVLRSNRFGGAHLLEVGWRCKSIDELRQAITYWQQCTEP